MLLRLRDRQDGVGLGQYIDSAGVLAFLDKQKLKNMSCYR